MVDIIKMDGEAAFQLLKENGFKGAPDEAANGGLVMVGNGANITIANSGNNIINSPNSGVNSGDTINRLLSIIEAQSQQITRLTTQLTELLSQGIITSTKN